MYSIIRHQINNQVYYAINDVPENEKFYSVTTILQSYNSDTYRFANLDVMEKHIRMEKGTRIHSYLQDIANINSIKIRDDDKSQLNKIIIALDKLQAVIKGVELSVVSKIHTYAGRLDCIAYIEYGNKKHLAIIDYKTTKRAKNKDQLIGYYMQLAAYRQAYYETYGALTEAICVIICNQKNKIQFNEI